MTENKQTTIEILESMHQEMDTLIKRKNKLLGEIKAFLLHHTDDSNFPELMGTTIAHMIKHSKTNNSFEELKKGMMEKNIFG